MSSVRLSPYYLKRNCSKAELERKLEELDGFIYRDIGTLEDEKRRKAINLRRCIRKKQFKGKQDVVAELFSEDARYAYKQC